MREAVLAAGLLLLGPSLLAQSSASPPAADPAAAAEPTGGDASAAGAPDPAGAGADGGAAAAAATTAPAFEPAAAVQRGCAILLEMQEGEGRREWPYEGVYREREPGRSGLVIPLAYRVGGTAIACLALIEAPGYADESHDARRAAVARGLDFVLESLDSPLLAPARDDDYDVRGWAFITALQLCAELQRRGLVPADREPAVAAAAPRLIEALAATEIPRAGGWNYANHRAPAPFMTAPALQALFAAAQAGHAVPAAIVERALDSLERGRAASGSIAYSTPVAPRDAAEEDDLGAMDKLPGAIGRMLACEATLTLAGRGDAGRLAAAVEAFFQHWDQLEARRKQTGTHTGAYGVAPYYFMFAHQQAALAIELLPAAERERQRARLDALLARVAEPEGGWNDRVFPRSRGYGTAMGVLALLQREQPELARWAAPAKPAEGPPATR